MSDLRRDPVSGDWIIIAPERSARLHRLISRRKRKISSRKNCPFENLKQSGNWPPILSYPHEKAWEAVIIPNKYPALIHRKACAHLVREGPYEREEGIGHHDLVLTRDHTVAFADLKIDEAMLVFTLLKKRYELLASDECNFYTSTFFNYGATAGASVDHPHLQMITLPIIPPNVRHSFEGSLNYFKKHRKCVHCALIAYEKKTRIRVIKENRAAIAIAPFASRSPFEVRVFPKRHLPYFEKTSDAELRFFVATLQEILKSIRTHLYDPDLNFFIHTAPLKKQKQYSYYHWHVEIVSKITIPAGFELSTGVEINVMDPETAARTLRK